MPSLPTPPWENEHYSFTGPGVAISCEVNYNRSTGVYVATGDTGIVATAHSKHEAALRLFTAWLYPPEDRDHG